MLVPKLTQKDVLNMSKEERITKIDELQDKLCNIDYKYNEEIYDRLAYNLNIIEQKALYNEF